MMFWNGSTFAQNACVRELRVGNSMHEIADCGPRIELGKEVHGRIAQRSVAQNESNIALKRRDIELVEIRAQPIFFGAVERLA